MATNRAKTAQEMMTSHKMCCSQAVLCAFCEDYGLDKSLALPLAKGFCGGMGHTGQTCGAVTGAYMVLGMDQKKTPDNTYELIGEFNREFKRLHHTLNCTELTGYDLRLPEQLDEAKQKGVFANVCPNLVSDAVKILEVLLKKG